MAKPVFGLKKIHFWRISSLVLLVLLILSVIQLYDGFNLNNKSKEEVGQEVLDFININIFQGQVEGELLEVTEEYGMYSIKIDVEGQELNPYATKDGKVFFPQGIELGEIEEDPTDEESTDELTGSVVESNTEGMVKSDKPVVELFVMSHCPYGTQAEKGMIPVLELLKDKIDFELKFVYYVMHGEKEIVEQTNQYCIQKEQSDKFIGYLTCFLEAGESDTCLNEAKIDEKELESCFEKTDEEFSIMENLENQESWLNGRFPKFDISLDDNSKYGVGGSPTLVINGETVSSGRAPAAYLSAICSAFNDAPEECSEELSTDTPTPMWGWSASGNPTDAQC